MRTTSVGGGQPSRADKAELERRRKALSRQFKRDCTKMVHRDKDTLINLQLAEIRRLQRQNAQVALRGWGKDEGPLQGPTPAAQSRV